MVQNLYGSSHTSRQCPALLRCTCLTQLSSDTRRGGNWICLSIFIPGGNLFPAEMPAKLNFSTLLISKLKRWIRVWVRVGLKRVNLCPCHTGQLDLIVFYYCRQGCYCLRCKKKKHTQSTITMTVSHVSLHYYMLQCSCFISVFSE